MKDILLNKQYDYYVNHESDLLEKYNGKYLIISDNLDVYAFTRGEDAYKFGAEKVGLGNFLLQECKPGVLDVVHYINWL